MTLVAGLLGAFSTAGGATAAPVAAPSPAVTSSAQTEPAQPMQTLPATLSLPTSTASPAVRAQLNGSMAAYNWFPGRWACRTALSAEPAKEPTPGKLWVVVDVAHNALKEYFSSTTTGGKPYRSDDVLRYDTSKHVFLRSAVDANGSRILLAAPGPFRPTLRYSGFIALQNHTLYRLRAVVTYDAAATQVTTATAFYNAATKTWPVQTTTVCTKIAP